ncbi:MAG: hypothetical protein M3N13_06905 [Candidatus Eremiobacteraeota bacterium]|nr:hypothetical protein [Candidatus Eremiobacteraeota bacterium]
MRMYTGAFIFAWSLFVLSPPVAADQTTAGVSVNATTGHHIESYGAQVVPFVPLPMFEIDHVHRRLHLRLEAVPPIGPVSLGGGSPFGYGSDPRLTYVDGEARYTFAGARYEVGIGETILNQRTFYPPSPGVQASRVVGARYVANALVYAMPTEQLVAALAIDPSLHGIQYTMLPNATAIDYERGSLIDASLRWTFPHKRMAFSYGLRYLNYTAQYTTSGLLADRNHFLMPFVAFDWKLRADPSPLTTKPPDVVPNLFAPRSNTNIGLSFFGTSGSHSVTSAPVSARSFNLLTAIEAEHRIGRLSVAANGFFASPHVDVFGSNNLASSLLDIGVRYRMPSNRYAFGLSETVINQTTVNPLFSGSYRARNDGLRYTVMTTVASMPNREVTFELGVVPFLHSVSYLTRETAPNVFATSTSPRRGTLIDSSLRFDVRARSFDFSYGLRYVDQSILIASFPGTNGFAPASFVSHDPSLMPFVGISEALGP